MKIFCNGQVREIASGTTLQALLDELNLELDSVVAEINKQIIDRDQYDQTILAEQDQVELIRFVGGG